MACDPFWNKTVLACHFDGVDSSTSFVDEKGHTLTANGNAQLTTTSPRFGTACATFDGASDYISIATANATDFNFGTGDFTIECFVKLAAMPTSDAWPTAWSSHMGVVCKGVPSSASGYNFIIGTTQIMWNNNDTAVGKGAHGMTTGVWYHIAVSRESGTLRTFVDGVLKGSSTGITSDYTYAQPLLIGTETGEGAWLNGQLDDLRITKAARYTANFTPDTSAFLTNQCTISGTVKDASNANAARLVRTYRRDTAEVLNLSISDGTTGVYSHPVETTGECFIVAHDGTPTDPYASSVKLALKMAGANGATTFTDDAGHTTTANGDVKIAGGAFPYGRSAAYFDGTGDYIACTYSTDYEVGSGDFTVEFWFKVPNVSGQKTLFAFQADFHIGIFLNGNRMNCFASSNGSSWDIISGDTGGSYGAGYTDVTANVWHHFAWVRSGSTWTMWLDGQMDRQLTGITATVFSRNEALNVGRWGNAGYFMNGYIKDFRLTKGVARYSLPFAPPLPDFLTVSGGTENAVILDRITPI